MGLSVGRKVAPTVGSRLGDPVFPVVGDGVGSGLGLAVARNVGLLEAVGLLEVGAGEGLAVTSSHLLRELIQTHAFLPFLLHVLAFALYRPHCS